MNTLPPLPQELEGFSDIVEAHATGDSLKLLEAINSTIGTLRRLILNSEMNTLDLQRMLIQVDTYKLRNLQTIIHKPMSCEDFMKTGKESE